MNRHIFKKSWLVALIIIIFTVLNIPKADALQTKPPTTTSWYVYVTNDETDQTLYNWMYSVGYQAGQNDLALP